MTHGGGEREGLSEDAVEGPFPDEPTRHALSDRSHVHVVHHDREEEEEEERDEERDEEEEARARDRAPLTSAELNRFRMIMEQERQQMVEEVATNNGPLGIRSEPQPDIGRTQDLEMVATHASVEGLRLPPDLIALAYDRNDGDIVNAIMNLTEPIFRSQLERELAERQAEAAEEEVVEEEEAEDDFEEEAARQHERARNELAFTMERFRRLGVQIPTEEEYIGRTALSNRSWAHVSRDEGELSTTNMYHRASSAYHTELVRVRDDSDRPRLGKSARVRAAALACYRGHLKKCMEKLEERVASGDIDEGTYKERADDLMRNYNLTTPTTVLPMLRRSLAIPNAD